MTSGFAAGTVLVDRYRIVAPLAEGDMGAVYEGRHLVIGKRVAIKTMRAEFQDRAQFVQRFLREARAASMIDHGNVVNVLDVDQTPDGVVFLVMEYLEGSDLSRVLAREGRLAWPRARRIALQIGAALVAAHGRGIVHRDLKPGNCFLVGEPPASEVVKLLDFGLARVLESDGSRGARTDTEDGTGRGLRWLRTGSGEVFGSPAYMAPEHLIGDPHDHRVDIYALGVILHEMLTGAVPFVPDASGPFIRQVLHERPEPPSRRVPDIPPELDRIVLRALEKRPEDRFFTMQALVEALAAVRNGDAGSVDGAADEQDESADAEPPPAVSGAPAQVPVAVEPPAVSGGPEQTPGAGPPAPPGPALPSRRRLVVGVAGAALAVVALAVVFSAGRSAPEVAAPPAPVVAAASVEPPPADAPVTSPPEPPPAPPVTSPPPGPPDPTTAKPHRTPPRASSPDPPARTSDLPSMMVTPNQRRELFSSHREAIEARCKQPNGLASALLVLQVTIEAARITRAALEGDLGRERQAAARCVEKYLRDKVKVPKSFSGRATFVYTF